MLRKAAIRLVLLVGSSIITRLIHGIYCEWYSTGVRLASRIFGELQRKVTRIWEERKEERGD